LLLLTFSVVDYFDIIWMVVIDPMHFFFTDSGICGKIMKHVMVTSATFQKHVASMNQFLANVKFPHIFHRNSREFTSKRKFKSTEYQLLAFYSMVPMLLDAGTSKEFMEFVIPLVDGIRRLSQSLRTSEVDEIEAQFHQVFQKWDKFVGKHTMTINVHFLLDICACVRQFGPLYSFDAFAFEDYIGLMKNLMKGTGDFESQVHFHLKMQQIIPIVKSECLETMPTNLYKILEKMERRSHSR
jgi:hypothetical protein